MRTLDTAEHQNAIAVARTRNVLLATLLASCSYGVLSAAEAATTIDTTPNNSGIGPFGETFVATHGQTFTAPAVDTKLDSFTFFQANPSVNPVNFGAYVMAWDAVSNRATGPVLFSTGMMTAPGGVIGYQPYLINTGGLTLNAGQQYVAFFSVSNFFDTIPDNSSWALRTDDPYAGGGFVYAINGSDFGALSSASWIVGLSTIYDLAFIMNFSAPGLVCPMTGGADVCLITSADSPPFSAVDGLAGTDTLQLGGTTDFSFDVAAIGTTFTNFETFQKINTANVTLTGVAGSAASWDIQGGTLTASTGNNILDASTVNVGGAGTFAVASSETIGRLTGSGLTTLAAGHVLTVGDATNFSYTGTTSGAGGLTKVGLGTMSTGSLGHLGLTTVSAGTLNVNGTIADSVVVNSGAVLSGNATIAGTLTLGVGSSLSPGNSPGTTVMGGLVGGGMIFTEVQFNNAGAPVNGTTHDFVSITGNVTGTTILNVVPFAPSNAPAATVGNGIELVRVGGTTGATSFQLAAPLIFGALEYTLNYLPNYSGTLDGYFLQSRASESMFGEAAMLAVGQMMIAGCLTGEDALVGDGNAHRGRAWARAGGGNRESGADTGLNASSDYSCASGGVDLRTAGQWRVGLSGGYGTASSDVLTPAGAGNLEGDGGIVQFFAEFHSGNFFANVSGGWGVLDWTFDGPITAASSAQTDGALGALQLGHYWPIKSWRLGAIGEIAYNGMDCSSNCFLAGTVADANEWSYKGTVRADGTLLDGKVRPYLALSLASAGTNTVSNGAASVTTDTNALQFIAKGGANFMVDTQTALFINGGMTEGVDNDVTGWDIGAGIKALW